MASEADTAFTGETVRNFAAYGDTIRGEIRYQLVRQNIARFIGKEIHILDVGGGAGLDSVYFAQQGHHVTLLEPAADQLELARLHIESAGVRNRIETVQGTIEDVIGKPSVYDLVLSHCVAMYLENPYEYFANLAGVTKAAGHISILDKGYAAAYAHAVSIGDFSAAYQLAETGKCTNRLGRETWAFRPDTLEQSLENAGLWLRQWSGVRVLHDADMRRTQDVPGDELASIIAHEAEAGSDLATRGMGQLLHFIVQK